MKKMKEEILKALKEEMVKGHATECRECMADTNVDFYANIPSDKKLPETMIYENKMTPCFYRLCAILEYYFGIYTEETQKIYLKHGRYTDLSCSCEIFKARKDFWQEVYTLCLKRTNFNKI